MLKTNTKKFKGNVHNFIMSNVDFSGYEEFENVNTENIADVCTALFAICKSERQYLKYRNNAEMLIDWMQGLPASFHTLDILGYDAYKIICEWREATEEETVKEEKRYANTDSWKFALEIIAREILNNKA